MATARDRLEALPLRGDLTMGMLLCAPTVHSRGSEAALSEVPHLELLLAAGNGRLELEDPVVWQGVHSGGNRAQVGAFADSSTTLVSQGLVSKSLFLCRDDFLETRWEASAFLAFAPFTRTAELVAGLTEVLRSHPSQCVRHAPVCSFLLKVMLCSGLGSKLEDSHLLLMLLLLLVLIKFSRVVAWLLLHGERGGSAYAGLYSALESSLCIKERAAADLCFTSDLIPLPVHRVDLRGYLAVTALACQAAALNRVPPFGINIPKGEVTLRQLLRGRKLGESSMAFADWVLLILPCSPLSVFATLLAQANGAHPQAPKFNLIASFVEKKKVQGVPVLDPNEKPRSLVVPQKNAKENYFGGPTADPALPTGVGWRSALAAAMNLDKENIAPQAIFAIVAGGMFARNALVPLEPLQQQYCRGSVDLMSSLPDPVVEPALPLLVALEVEAPGAVVSDHPAWLARAKRLDAVELVWHPWTVQPNNLAALRRWLATLSLHATPQLVPRRLSFGTLVLFLITADWRQLGLDPLCASATRNLRIMLAEALVNALGLGPGTKAVELPDEQRLSSVPELGAGGIAREGDLLLTEAQWCKVKSLLPAVEPPSVAVLQGFAALPYSRDLLQRWMPSLLADEPSLWNRLPVEHRSIRSERELLAQLARGGTSAVEGVQCLCLVLWEKLILPRFSFFPSLPRTLGIEVVRYVQWWALTGGEELLPDLRCEPMGIQMSSILAEASRERESVARVFETYGPYFEQLGRDFFLPLYPPPQEWMTSCVFLPGRTEWLRQFPATVGGVAPTVACELPFDPTTLPRPSLKSGWTWSGLEKVLADPLGPHVNLWKLLLSEVGLGDQESLEVQTTRLLRGLIGAWKRKNAATRILPSDKPSLLVPRYDPLTGFLLVDWNQIFTDEASLGNRPEALYQATLRLIQQSSLERQAEEVLGSLVSVGWTKLLSFSIGILHRAGLLPSNSPVEILFPDYLSSDAWSELASEATAIMQGRRGESGAPLARRVLWRLHKEVRSLGGPKRWQEEEERGKKGPGKRVLWEAPREELGRIVHPCPAVVHLSHALLDLVPSLHGTMVPIALERGNGAAGLYWAVAAWEEAAKVLEEATEKVWKDLAQATGLEQGLQLVGLVYLLGGVVEEIRRKVDVLVPDLLPSRLTPRGLEEAFSEHRQQLSNLLESAGCGRSLRDDVDWGLLEGAAEAGDLEAGIILRIGRALFSAVSLRCAVADGTWGPNLVPSLPPAGAILPMADSPYPMAARPFVCEGTIPPLAVSLLKSVEAARSGTCPDLKKGLHLVAHLTRERSRMQFGKQIAAIPRVPRADKAREEEEEEEEEEEGESIRIEQGSAAMETIVALNQKGLEEELVLEKCCPPTRLEFSLGGLGGATIPSRSFSPSVLFSLHRSTELTEGERRLCVESVARCDLAPLKLWFPALRSVKLDPVQPSFSSLARLYHLVAFRCRVVLPPPVLLCTVLPLDLEPDPVASITLGLLVEEVLGQEDAALEKLEAEEEFWSTLATGIRDFHLLSNSKQPTKDTPRAVWSFYLRWVLKQSRLGKEDLVAIHRIVQETMGREADMLARFQAEGLPAQMLVSRFPGQIR